VFICCKNDLIATSQKRRGKMSKKIVLILTAVMFTMSACENSLVECDADKLYAIQKQVDDKAEDVLSTCSEDDYAEFSAAQSDEEKKAAVSKLVKKCQVKAVEECEIEFEAGCQIRTNGPFYGIESEGTGTIMWEGNGNLKIIYLEISDPALWDIPSGDTVTIEGTFLSQDRASMITTLSDCKLIIDK